VQQRLIRIEAVAEFEQIVARLRDAGAPPRWQERGAAEPVIPVPKGPIERW
jgi:hypothetical protein